MTEIINQLNNITPLGIIALLGIVIYQMVMQYKKPQASQESVDTIAGNHLHGLPEMSETLKRIEDKLDKINDNITYVKARINGK